MQLSYDKECVLKKNIPDNILGVYYLIDSAGSILYIGKSIDVKKRMSQHIYKGRKRLIQAFKTIRIEVMHSELEALLFESQEIKKYRPIFNRKLRKSKRVIALYTSRNKEGYKFYYLANEGNGSPLIDFMSKKSAERFLLRLTQKHQLCEKINGLDKSKNSCFQYHLKNCKGACLKIECPETYNSRFDNSNAQILRYPNDCKLIFTFNDIQTYVTIENNKVSNFGVNGKTHYKIEYFSNDELRIVNTFKNKFSNYCKQSYL